jgi:hypothetical protein
VYLPLKPNGLGGFLFNDLLRGGEKGESMKKLIWIVIAIVLLITACKPETVQSDDFVVTPVPTRPALANRPVVTDEITANLRENLAGTLEIDSYVATDMGDGTVDDILSLYLVSTGIFETTKLQLDNGEILKFDIVYAYQLNHARQVIVVPVAVGMESEDGDYVYFSDSYIYNLVTNASDSITRFEALNDAEKNLPAGRVFVVSISHLTKNRKVDWSHCPDDYYVMLDGKYCQVAAQIDYGNMNLVAQRAATHLPDDWFLVGWFFNTSPDLGMLDL